MYMDYFQILASLTIDRNLMLKHMCYMLFVKQLCTCNCDERKTKRMQTSHSIMLRS